MGVYNKLNKLCGNTKKKKKSKGKGKVRGGRIIVYDEKKKKYKEGLVK